MHYDPYCNCQQPHKNPSVCISNSCKVPNPFETQKCRRKQHQQCSKLQYKSLIQRFHSIQKINTPQFLRFEEKVESLFEQMMRQLKQQFIKFREQFQLTNSTAMISKIYERIKNHQEKQITGSMISSALKQKLPMYEKHQPKNQLHMRMLKKQILYDHFADILKKLPKFYSVSQFMKQVNQRSVPNKIKDIAQKFQPTRYRRIPGGLLDESFLQFEKLLGKNIYSCYVIYKASHHHFSAEIFHKKCDNISNTITVVLTQYGKIIGGFCPFKWKSFNQWKYFADIKNQCFLFSTSPMFNSIKFIPSNKRKQFAIGMHKDYGPCFGDDLVVYNHANNGRNCWSNFPDVYQGKKQDTIIPHSTQVLKQFIGCSDHFQTFNLIEWEVYHICFSKQQQIIQQKIQQYNNL